MFRLGYSIKTENGLETGARGEQGATANTYRTSFGGDKFVLKLIQWGWL